MSYMCRWEGHILFRIWNWVMKGKSLLYITIKTFLICITYVKCTPWNFDSKHLKNYYEIAITCILGILCIRGNSIPSLFPVCMLMYVVCSWTENEEVWWFIADNLNRLGSPYTYVVYALPKKETLALHTLHKFSLY